MLHYWREVEKGRCEMKVQCCVCKKVRDESGWVNTESGALQGQAVSHGYCPSCLEEAHREIRAMRYGLLARRPLAANQ